MANPPSFGTFSSNVNTNTTLASPLASFDNANNLDSMSQWPSEMSDTMLWSAQFLHPSFNLASNSRESFSLDGAFQGG